MIIGALDIRSFAGIGGGSITFKPGLNILLGPNEAGKSTVFRALYHALCTPTSLTKRQLHGTLGPYLPLDGGDTIEVMLSFSSEGDVYQISKRWGHSPMAELKLPSGSVLSDNLRITEVIENAMSVTPATLRSVLMTTQSQLVDTLSALGKDKTTLFSMHDLLRRAAQETDGISVEGFREVLEREARELYGRWDNKTMGPEGGRGIQNPWQKGVGTILHTWYRKERLRSQYELIIRQEDELSRIYGEISTHREKLITAEAFLAEHKRAYDESGNSESLGYRLGEARRIERDLSMKYDRWPELGAEAQRMEVRIGEIQDAQTKTHEQLEMARKRATQEKLLTRVARLQDLKEKLDGSAGRLEKVKKTERSVVSRLRKLEGDITALKRQLLSGSSTITVEASEALELDIRKNIGKPEHLSIGKGEEKTLSGDGLIELEHKAWRVRIQPGAVDYQEIELKYREALRERMEILHRLDAVSLDEAEHLLLQYEALQGEADAANHMFEDELGDDSLEKLIGDVEELGGLTDTPSVEVLAKQLADFEHEDRSLQSNKKSLSDELKELITDYGEREKLLDRLLDARRDSQQIQKELDSSIVLPAGYPSWDAFRNSYRRQLEIRESLRDELHNREKDRVELEAKMPDESAEELSVEIEGALIEHEQAIATAIAVDRVIQVAEELLSGAGADHTESLKRSCEGYMSKLTNGHYTSTTARNGLPDEVSGSNGIRYPYDLLSAGTKDSFALALRLSLADLFLSDSSGFLVLDDPLVDMDPDRRAAASKVLTEYSATRQLILFTCHPTHAGLFPDESRISLLFS